MREVRKEEQKEAFVAFDGIDMFVMLALVPIFDRVAHFPRSTNTI